MSQFSRLSLVFLLASGLTLGLFTAQPAAAQQDVQSEPAAAAEEQDWYYGAENSQPTKSVGRLRIEQQAQRRAARLESMRWYGFSASRPTAAAMPFTTMYSPAWTRDGGRPFAWYIGERPVLAPRYVYYR